MRKLSYFIKVLKFYTVGGGTSFVMTLGNGGMNRYKCLELFSPSISTVSLKMSLDLVLLVEKLYLQQVL